MRASAQSTSSPFIQIFSVSRIVCSFSAAAALNRTGRALSLPGPRRSARPREAHEIARREPGHVLRRAGADPDAVVAEQRLLDQHPLDERQRERGDGARLEAGRPPYLVGPRDLRAGAAERAGDLRRVGSAVARYEHHRGTAVAVEHERLHDPARLAADRLRPLSAVGVPSSNSSRRASTPAARRYAETRSTGSGQTSLIRRFSRPAPRTPCTRACPCGGRPRRS